MKNIKIETLLFFGKEIVSSLRESFVKLNYVFDMGKPLYMDLLDYLKENSEVLEEELKNLQKILVIFDYSKEEVQLMESYIQEIKEGKTHWEPINMELIEKMLKDHLVEEKETMRYLAHRNHYHQVIQWCESKQEIFSIAKKYGSEQTRTNFNKYEIMKKLESKLVRKGIQSKKAKI